MHTFSMATNWDDDLIKQTDTLDVEDKVVEVYGKLGSDFIGGGRASSTLCFVSKKHAVRHIKLVKGTGRKFNYLLNALCLDNREFTRNGQRQIRNLLSWLDSLGVDAVTVANPYLGHLIKKEYPRFKLNVSNFASVDNVDRAKFWANEIGADKITLSSYINRNFSLLKVLRSEIECKLQFVAGQACLRNCPFSLSHSAFLSHASQSRHHLQGFGIDWSIIQCRHKLFTQAEEFIKAAWIRPEDLGYYGKIGIDSFKLTDRTRDTQSNISVLKAYLQGGFDGNLADLFFPRNKSFNKERAFRAIKFLLRPAHINIIKMRQFSRLFFDVGIYVDNRRLDGFLDYFVEDKCKADGCEKCGYCRNTAERIVQIDPEYKKETERIFRDVIEGLTKGTFFKYF